MHMSLAPEPSFLSTELGIYFIIFIYTGNIHRGTILFAPRSLPTTLRSLLNTSVTGYYFRETQA